MSRIDSVRKLLSNNDEALLISSNSNVYYLSGFNNSEGVMLITKDEAYLLVDFRYIEAAKNTVKNCKVALFSNLITSIKDILIKHNIKSLYIESNHTTVSSYTKYLHTFNEIGVSVVSNGALDKVVSNLRMIKDEGEISFIKEAQKITEKAYLEVLNFVKPGITEKTVANELGYLLKRYGAEDVSFDLITITGKKTSLPHGVPTESEICSGDFFTMDIGATYNGYHSDMTRTVAVKSYTDEMKQVYDIVYKAQVTALESVKSGIKSFEVDKIARDIITNAGYGECFGHSTGHGVGLDIHELPNVSPNGEAILSQGMVITVEPGIYIKDKFGVRIEDMVLVQTDGYKNFATLPKELIVV